MTSATGTAARIAGHYDTSGMVLERIDDALRRKGVSPKSATPEDLRSLDELHTGGAAATDALLDQLDIAPGMHVVDLGAGIGGAARHIARRFGARVTGIDLTEEFVATGRVLSVRVGLSGLVDLQQGSVTDLPLAAAAFDLATMFHVGMNISDKAALFSEAARVLKPGGHFALFDVMLDGAGGDLTFPLPWADTGAVSFAAAPDVYRQAGAAAGLRLTAERDRREFASRTMGKALQAIEAAADPVVHPMMGETVAEKTRNYVANVEMGRISPVEMIFEKPA